MNDKTKPIPAKVLTDGDNLIVEMPDGQRMLLPLQKPPKQPGPRRTARMEAQKRPHPVCRSAVNVTMGDVGKERVEKHEGWELRCPGCETVIAIRRDRPPDTYDHGMICSNCAAKECAEEP